MNARANRMGAREARARARSGFTRRARRRRLDGVDGVVRVRVGVEGDVRGTSSMLATRDARELTLKTLVGGGETDDDGSESEGETDGSEAETDGC